MIGLDGRITDFRADRTWIPPRNDKQTTKQSDDPNWKFKMSSHENASTEIARLALSNWQVGTIPPQLKQLVMKSGRLNLSAFDVAHRDGITALLSKIPKTVCHA